MGTANVTVHGHVPWNNEVTALHLHMNTVTSGHNKL